MYFVLMDSHTFSEKLLGKVVATCCSINQHRVAGSQWTQRLEETPPVTTDDSYDLYINEDQYPDNYFIVF